MRQSKYITIITMACALFFASCSDEYMENMNTDPSKAATMTRMLSSPLPNCKRTETLV